MPFDLTTKHPAFEAQEKKYELWSDLYEGGDAIEGRKEYLVRHPFETEKQHTIRLQRSAYKNYAAAIVTVFSSALWQKPPTRTLPPRLEELAENVDLSGTSADRFFQDITRQAAARGVQFVLVDMPGKPQEAPDNLATDQKLNRRPYFVQLSPESVIDWSFDRDGLLAYAVVTSKAETSADPFQGHKSRDEFRLWRRDGWELWVMTEAGAAVMEASGPNPLGVVPVVPFYFEEQERFVGVSCLDDVASLCKRVYMRDSELDKALFDSAVAIFFAKGFSEKELDGFVRSSSNGLRSESTDAAVEYIEPEGRSFDALRQSIIDDEKAIREIALRQVRPDSRQVESAESKRMDSQQLDSQLARFSVAMAHAEARCWDLAGKWLGMGEDMAEVEYNRDFHESEISGDLLRAFSEMRKNRDISRETLWQIYKGLDVLPDNFEPTDEVTRLENEERTPDNEFRNLAGNLFQQGLRQDTGQGRE